MSPDPSYALFNACIIQALNANSTRLLGHGRLLAMRFCACAYACIDLHELDGWGSVSHCPFKPAAKSTTRSTRPLQDASREERVVTPLRGFAPLL